MQSMIDLLMATLVIGAGATLVMDLWALFLRRVLAIPSLSYCLVGRWVAHMPCGIFHHTKITATKAWSGECVLGWGVHYLIGIIYAGFLVLPYQGVWLHWLGDSPLYAFGVALTLGVVTVVFPFLVMQPALGFGLAAARNPNPMHARIKTLLTHGVFGVGLYVMGCIYQILLTLVK